MPVSQRFALAVFVRLSIMAYFLEAVKYYFYFFAGGGGECLRGGQVCGDKWHDHAGTNAGEIFTRGGECVEVANGDLAGGGLYLY